MGAGAIAPPGAPPASFSLAPSHPVLSPRAIAPSPPPPHPLLPRAKTRGLLHHATRVAPSMGPALRPGSAVAGNAIMPTGSRGFLILRKRGGWRTRSSQQVSLPLAGRGQGWGWQQELTPTVSYQKPPQRPPLPHERKGVQSNYRTTKRTRARLALPIPEGWVPPSPLLPKPKTAAGCPAAVSIPEPLPAYAAAASSISSRSAVGPESWPFAFTSRSTNSITATGALSP